MTVISSTIFFRRLKAKITETKGQEAADAFAKKAQTCVKEVLGNFKNYDFYLGKCSTLENLDGNYYLMCQYFKNDVNVKKQGIIRVST